MTRVQIFTTAAIPWLTGTSLNPLYRAIHLAKMGHEVLLYFPWIEYSEQALLFDTLQFISKEKQESYINQYVKESMGIDVKHFTSLHIKWYPARYYQKLQSIFPACFLPTLYEEKSVIILEEPEHLFFFHPNKNTPARDKKRVIGICHTNYFFYMTKFAGFFAAYICRWYIKLLINRHCTLCFTINKAVINYTPEMLSVPIQGYSPQYTTNSAPKIGNIYFVGKIIWQKGFSELIKLLSNTPYSIDVYGSGNDIEKIRKKAEKNSARLYFKGLTSSPQKDLRAYSIFINCSLSEVLCSSTLEALAMGMWVLLPIHPSTDIFKNFKNVRFFSNKKEALAILATISTQPPPGRDPLLAHYTWDEATERLEYYIKKIANASNQL